ncbi:MAG TPA: GNAT family N-acetyltransferase [Polyangiaceae bacterium]
MRSNPHRRARLRLRAPGPAKRSHRSRGGPTPLAVCAKTWHKTLLKPAYTIRLSRGGELHLLPDIERRAASQFEPWAAELALTPEILEGTIPLEALHAANDDGRLWVAADIDDHPVGFALVRELGLFAHLEELDVLPEHGRQGLGTSLLEAVCAWAHTRGFAAVTLSTFRDVPWNAAFYGRRGFEAMGRDELPPELLEIVGIEEKKGLLTDRRVVMMRRARPPLARGG